MSMNKDDIEVAITATSSIVISIKTILLCLISYMQLQDLEESQDD